MSGGAGGRGGPDYPNTENNPSPLCSPCETQPFRYFEWFIRPASSVVFGYLTEMFDMSFGENCIIEPKRSRYFDDCEDNSIHDNETITR